MKNSDVTGICPVLGCTKENGKGTNPNAFVKKYGGNPFLGSVGQVLMRGRF